MALFSLKRQSKDTLDVEVDPLQCTLFAVASQKYEEKKLSVSDSLKELKWLSQEAILAIPQYPLVSKVVKISGIGCFTRHEACVHLVRPKTQKAPRSVV
jgi:hypothetical protein